MLNAVLLCMCCNGEFSSFAWEIESQKEKLKWVEAMMCTAIIIYLKKKKVSTAIVLLLRIFTFLWN